VWYAVAGVETGGAASGRRIAVVAAEDVAGESDVARSSTQTPAGFTLTPSPCAAAVEAQLASVTTKYVYAVAPAPAAVSGAAAAARPRVEEEEAGRREVVQDPLGAAINAAISQVGRSRWCICVGVNH
jgi:hypothetical protein